MGLVYCLRPAILCTNLSLNPFSHESSWPLLEVIGMEICRVHTLFLAAEGRHITTIPFSLEILLKPLLLMFDCFILIGSTFAGARSKHKILFGGSLLGCGLCRRQTNDRCTPCLARPARALVSRMALIGLTAFLFLDLEETQGKQWKSRPGGGAEWEVSVMF